MTYTGHKKLLIDGKDIVQHLMPTLQQEAQFYGVEIPRSEQIALVVSALRMHHTMMFASNYDFSELHARDKVTDFYPIQSSIGRYLRDAGGDILRNHQLKGRD